MIRLFLSRQFLGFVAVGGGAALLNWLTRIALSFWLPFPVAVALAYAVGMMAAFALNSVYVFPRSTRPRALQARDFVIVNLLSFPVVWIASLQINRGLLALGMNRYNEALAHGIAMALPMVTSFLIYKFYAFKE